jgi:hypothetical protein
MKLDTKKANEFGATAILTSEFTATVLPTTGHPTQGKDLWYRPLIAYQKTGSEKTWVRSDFRA